MGILDIPILATAIAVVISWAMFAIFCSLVHESLVQIKAERGRFMKNYMYSQLKDVQNGVNWAEKIYTHGSIDLLSRDPGKPTNDISPRLFAETLVEVVGSARLVQNRAEEFKAKGLVTGYSPGMLGDFKFATQILNPSDLATLFKQAMHTAELKSSQAELKEAEIYAHVIEHLENWFIQFTERLSLWYKKKTRERLFILGILIGTFLNVDSVQLFGFYEHSPEAKAAVIQFYKSHPEYQEASFLSVEDRNASDPSMAKNPFVQSIDSLIGATKLPIGFKYNIFHAQEEKGLEVIVWKILGIILSGFAASLGAPFWFDILKKATSSKI